MRYFLTSCGQQNSAVGFGFSSGYASHASKQWKPLKGVIWLWWWTLRLTKVAQAHDGQPVRASASPFHTRVTCCYNLSFHALFTVISFQGDSSPQQNGAGLFGGRSKSSPDAPTGPQKQKKIGAKLVDAKPAFGDQVCCEILLIQLDLLRAQCSVLHVIGLHQQAVKRNAICNMLCQGPA